MIAPAPFPAWGIVGAILGGVLLSAAGTFSVYRSIQMQKLRVHVKTDEGRQWPQGPEHHPCVEILFKGAKVGQIDFTLTVELTLEGFVLQIRGGRIKAIQTGTLKGQGSLALESTVVLEKEFRTIGLPGMLQLGEGIPLR